MSRIGKLPVNLPKGVTVSVSDTNVVSVKGPLGELTQTSRQRPEGGSGGEPDYYYQDQQNQKTINHFMVFTVH